MVVPAGSLSPETRVSGAPFQSLGQGGQRLGQAQDHLAGTMGDLGHIAQQVDDFALTLFGPQQDGLAGQLGIAVPTLARGVGALAARCLPAPFQIFPRPLQMAFHQVQAGAGQMGQGMVGTLRQGPFQQVLGFVHAAHADQRLAQAGQGIGIVGLDGQDVVVKVAGGGQIKTVGQQVGQLLASRDHVGGLVDGAPQGRFGGHFMAVAQQQQGQAVPRPGRRIRNA